AIELANFGFDRAKFLGAAVDLKKAFVVEYGQQQHGHCEEAENAQCDSNDDCLSHKLRPSLGLRATALALRGTKLLLSTVSRIPRECPDPLWMWTLRKIGQPVPYRTDASTPNYRRRTEA